MSQANHPPGATGLAQVTRTGILSAGLLSVVAYYDESNQPAQKQAIKNALT